MNENKIIKGISITVLLLLILANIYFLLQDPTGKSGNGLISTLIDMGVILVLSYLIFKTWKDDWS